MSVRDRISAAAFNLELEDEKKKGDQLVELYSRIGEDTRTDSVMKLLLNLQNTQVSSDAHERISIGSSIERFGQDLSSYKHYPSSMFNVKFDTPQHSNAKPYTVFSQEMFKGSLETYQEPFKLVPRLGLDYQSTLDEAASSCKEAKDAPSNDEGYISPGPGHAVDIWDNILEVQGVTKMTWESLGQKTFIREKPFLTESGPESVQCLRNSGKFSRFD